MTLNLRKDKFALSELATLFSLKGQKDIKGFPWSVHMFAINDFNLLRFGSILG